jgi:hypothetical protein
MLVKLLGYGLDQRIRVRLPVEVGVDISFCHHVKTISGLTLPPIQWLLETLLLMESSRCMTQTIQLHVISKVRDNWSYTITRRSRFIAGCNANHLAFTYSYYEWMIQRFSESQKR